MKNLKQYVIHGFGLGSEHDEFLRLFIRTPEGNQEAEVLLGHSHLMIDEYQDRPTNVLDIDMDINMLEQALDHLKTIRKCMTPIPNEVARKTRKLDDTPLPPFLCGKR